MIEWKEVEDYTSYVVSNTGIVKEKGSERVMPQTVNGGFWCTNLVSDYGKKALCKVHRLVAIAFIPNPEKLYSVEHKEDRLNNDVDNLRWKPKMVKEVKLKEPEPTVDYLGTTYTAKEFAKFCGVSTNLIRSRLSCGWTTVECKVGRRNFTGEGVSYDGYWFPTERECKAYQWEKELERREQAKIDKAKGIQERIKNRLAYRKAGVGNFVNYPIPGIVGRKQLKVYRVWSSMISRCYSLTNQSYDRYGGRGVYVCEEWHEFQNFAAWYYEQYQEDDWHIDKDILSPVDDVRYSPETCVFIPAVLNTLLATMQDQMRDLPMGVMRTKTKGVYSCQYITEGKRYHKKFTDIYEAGLYYKLHKEAEIKRFTEGFKDKLPESAYQFFINYTISIREEFQTPP